MNSQESYVGAKSADTTNFICSNGQGIPSFAKTIMVYLGRSYICCGKVGQYILESPEIL